MTTRIARVEVFDLDIALTSPFGIATGAQTRADNLVVAVTLEDGTVGYGEAAPFPAVNGETRDAAARAIAGVDLVGSDVRGWRRLSEELADLPAPSARCALETACIDAFCRHHRMPMHALFGGAETALTTDITLTTGEGPGVAGPTAAAWAAQGYEVLKIKVGGASLDDDRARLAEIAAAAPGCGLLLDANAALGSVDEAVALVDACDGRCVLFEQPFPAGDHALAAALVQRAVCPVAADESARTVEDVRRLIEARAANVVNLKATKAGLVACLDMALAARSAGLGLMMGAMVETPLGLTAAACLAAGLGGFRFIDLDTHLWMREPPIRGGFDQRGPQLDLSRIGAGHGVEPSSTLRRRS